MGLYMLSRSIKDCQRRDHLLFEAQKFSVYMESPSENKTLSKIDITGLPALRMRVKLNNLAAGFIPA